MRVSQGFRGTRGHCQNIEGNIEHMTPFFGNRETKLYNENLVSQFIKRGTNNYENAWKHGRVQEHKDPLWKTLINF